MDADGQHPPEVIPDMLAFAQRTLADYVGGSRYVSVGSADGLDGFKRQLISRGLALVQPRPAQWLGTPDRVSLT